MTPDFVAIDFETATRNMDSACSVGIAIVKNGQVADTFYSLIQPPDNLYDPNNIFVHGITEDDTRNALDFDHVWDQMRQYFGPYPVLAHNAFFDMSVLSMCCHDNYINPTNFKYMDTMHLAKNIVPGSKSLINCVNFFDIKLDNHHNAVADAVACAEIALACLKHSGEDDLLRFCFKNPHIMIYNFADLRPMEVFHLSKDRRPNYKKYVRPSEVSSSNTAFDITHPLYKKNIVFTGELSIARNIAMQMAADVGAIIKSSVSGKTDFLVAGQQDISLVGNSGTSSKERKAHELNSSGKGTIQIITEQDFINLVNPGVEAGGL